MHRFSYKTSSLDIEQNAEEILADNRMVKNLNYHTSLIEIMEILTLFLTISTYAIKNCFDKIKGNILRIKYENLDWE